MAKKQSEIQVSVFDHAGKVLDKATVTLESREQTSAPKHTLKFDTRQGAYLGSALAPGRYLLTAEASGYATDQRPVVALDPKTAGEIRERIQGIARKRKLGVVEVGEQVRRQHVHVFRFAANTPAAEQERTAEELRGIEGVTAAGPLVRFDKESLS